MKRLSFNMDMPRPRPPFLSRELTRHGKPVWYVRRGGKRIRLKAQYGTSEFDVEYQAALATTPQRSPKADVAAGTLAWLVDRYRDSGAWASLAVATRRQRENILKPILATAGNKPLASITAETIAAGRDRRATKTPFQARHFLDTMRGIFRWAVKAKLVAKDPTKGIEDPAMPKTSGFPPWTEDDVAAYERRWSIGTRQRVWLDVLLYTGLRRGDAARLGRQNVKNGVATLTTEKKKMVVSLPVLPVLQRTLDAGPCCDLAFIANANGKPFRKESFGNAFAEAARMAGVKKSCHGLRKIAATRCAENGATVPQMNAIFGWTGPKMALHYIEAADRKRLAADAMNKMQTSIVAP
jgi:integrase